MMNDISSNENFIARVDRAAEQLGLDRVSYEFVKHPERELKVSIPVEMDDGTVRLFEGYRIQHSTLRGPCKGGIRFHTSVSEDETCALAGLTTLQCALMNLPYGGAYGGVNVDVSELSQNEIKRLTRRYTAMILPFIGPNQDILAPDMNTNEEIMGWIMDTYSMMNGHAVQGIVTGKPIELGGSAGSEDAPARGLVFVTREMLKRMKQPIDQTSAAIIGMGKVGAAVADMMYTLGIKVIACGDISGAVFCPAGIHVPSLLKHMKSGKLCDYAENGATQITSDELLAIECDVLVPAAVEGLINVDNAETIRARLIVEGANSPTTVAADDILAKNGIVVVPDILANAGGMIVSYFEWVQNIQSLMWDADEVNRMLRQIIIKAFDDVWEETQANNTTLRMGACRLALQKVCRAKKIRGIFP